jgi:AcrR family transcriptional regulator
VPRKETGKRLEPQRLRPGRTNSAPDDRVRRSKASVLKVTAELLTETGLGGVSVDEVARRSGVAKTTIYRHWPTRSDLLIEACSQLGTEQEVPDTGSLEGDISALLTNLAELLHTARWASVVPSVIDAAERDAEVAAIHGRIQRGHARPFQEVIARAKRNGEISPSVDSATMIAALIGPLFYRRWFSRESLDTRFVKDVVNRAIEFAKPRTSPHPRSKRRRQKSPPARPAETG